MGETLGRRLNSNKLAHTQQVFAQKNTVKSSCKYNVKSAFLQQGWHHFVSPHPWGRSRTRKKGGGRKVGHFVPLPCPLPPTEQSILCKLHPLVWSGGLQWGEKWLIPRTQPYPHHRQKKGLMILVFLTILPCWGDEQREQKPLQVKAPPKKLYEQNSLQDHKAEEKHREGRGGERNRTPSPCA